MGDLPDHGRLEATGLPRLLLQLRRARFSGALVLTREHVGKRFLFADGAPVHAESNLASESLGVQLMDAGKLSREDHHRVADHVKQTGSKEGAALLELGLLGPRELFLALKDQVRSRLVECFGWPHGEFLLDTSSAPPADAQPFRVDLHAVLQEGLEAHWSGDRILADLAPRMEHYPKRTRRFGSVVARLRRDDAVEALLQSIDGTRSFWKSVQLAHTPRALAAAWVLDAAGALAYRDAPQGAQADALPDRDVEIVVEAGGRPAASRPAPARARADADAGSRAASRARAGENLAREIEEKWERLDELDHYELLGVAPNADAAAIRRAYLQAAKRFHPDALARAGLDPEQRARAGRVFAEFGKAHAVLADAKRRRDYDIAREAPEGELEAERLAQAETLYRKGEILLRSGNFKGALEFLGPAAEMWPDECAYQSAWGWALYKKQPSEAESARAALERAAQLDPDDAVTHFRLSVVLRSLGEMDASAQAAARAHALDPNAGS